MAEIQYERTRFDQGKGGNGILVEWKSVTNADTFKAFTAPAFSDASVQVDGTFDSSTVLIKGTNNPASTPTNLQSLVDIFENAMSFSAEAMRQLAQNPLTIQPSVSGGGGSQSLNVRILFYFKT
jgi:hypothetical protein|tara:strand:- start:187 stop:558 length:372 start_codon:yes stop_codon:yes gene_type:complete